jgi:hypothetical protein
MKQIHGAALAGALALFALPALAADSLTGKWSGTVQGGQGNDVPLVFDLKADGMKVTGTVTVTGGAAGGMPATAITDGKIEGDKVSFKLPFSMGPAGGGGGGGGAAPPIVITYEGTLNGDELMIKSTFPGFGGGEPTVSEFTAKRVKE